jgi:PAS domain-containing protein
VLQSEALKKEIAERIQAETAARESQGMLLTVLNSLDTLVYVSDMESYRVIFVNKYVKDLFGDIEGEICWQTLQAGQTGPCPFCTNDKLVDAAGNPTQLHKWESRNTRTGRWFYMVDRAVCWVDGRIVKLEIATDITESKEAEAEIWDLNEELELRVNRRTAELEVKNRELARMNKLFVGRELKMIELKERIRELEKGDGDDQGEMDAD